MNREITSENVVPVPRTGNGIWTDWESVPTILFAQNVGLVPRTSFLGLMKKRERTPFFPGCRARSPNELFRTDEKKGTHPIFPGCRARSPNGQWYLDWLGISYYNFICTECRARSPNELFRADEGISHYFGRMECRLILLIFRCPVALPRGVSLRGRRFVTWT